MTAYDYDNDSALAVAILKAAGALDSAIKNAKEAGLTVEINHREARIGDLTIKRLTKLWPLSPVDYLAPGSPQR